MIRNAHYFTNIQTIKMSTNKSFSTETSERYSRALFEVAKESGELEKVEADIKNFQSLMKTVLKLKILYKIQLKV